MRCISNCMVVSHGPCSFVIGWSGVWLEINITWVSLHKHLSAINFFYIYFIYCKWNNNLISFENREIRLLIRNSITKTLPILFGRHSAFEIKMMTPYFECARFSGGMTHVMCGSRLSPNIIPRDISNCRYRKKNDKRKINE